ncbi:HNH endonuclease [Leptospira sp. 85282-16]|uniref:HNH endonuclease n=1 Tax=Leptospira sp. 85282-16 TaxID=2971256 RepID=UPI0021BF3AA2|nr:HNH endonuclease [Leptospira sp. 85282-16]MCT8335855.1 HNH endonuclease [Leptospira sp. 85282-16]
MTTKTFNALISRGIPSNIADSIIKNKYTLQTLKLETSDKLKKLGLTEEQIEQIYHEERPPIPLDIVTKLIFESRNTCNICRDQSLPIIIHHIIPWHQSRNNAETNLILLCLLCHDKVHSKRDLTYNISFEQLKDLKQKWLKETKTHDSKIIQGLIIEKKANWDYINLGRLLELASSLNISLTTDYTSHLSQYNIVNNSGLLNDIESWKIKQLPQYYLYDFGIGNYLYYNYKDILTKVVGKIDIVNLDNIWSKKNLLTFVSTGTIIYCSGGLYFKDESEFNKDRNQSRRCYLQKRNIKVETTFDAYYSTSSSAKHDHLCGHKSGSILGIIKSIEVQEGILYITISCIAIGMNLKQGLNLSTLLPYDNISAIDFDTEDD